MSFDDNKIAHCLEWRMDRIDLWSETVQGVGEEERTGSMSQLAATSLVLQNNGNSSTRPPHNENTSLFHPIT